MSVLNIMEKNKGGKRSKECRLGWLENVAHQMGRSGKAGLSKSTAFKERPKEGKAQIFKC